jgi:hypothetical protein
MSVRRAVDLRRFLPVSPLSSPRDAKPVPVRRSFLAPWKPRNPPKSSSCLLLFEGLRVWVSLVIHT